MNGFGWVSENPRDCRWIMWVKSGRTYPHLYKSQLNPQFYGELYPYILPTLPNRTQYHGHLQISQNP